MAPAAPKLGLLAVFFGVNLFACQLPEYEEPV
jgi:hypothetical protein